MGLGERLARSAARALINERRYSVQGHRLFFKTVMSVGSSMPAGACTACEDAGGVPILRVDGLQGSEPRDLFLLHGGGFEAGSAKSHVPACARLCAGLGATGWVADYRRPPDHPFPAALDDALTAWRWMLARPGAAGIYQSVICGDSAGGGLALSLMMRLRDAGEALPCVAYLVSPFTDLTDHRRRNNGPLADELLASIGRVYTGPRDAHDPGISPLLGDLTGLPPMLIQSGVDEILAEDGERTAAHARACGVAVTFEPFPGTIHGLPFLTRVSSQARALSDRGVDFIRVHLSSCSGT